MRNREFVPTLILIFALFGGAYYFSETIQAPFTALLHSAKTTYHDTVEGIHHFIQEHFYQQVTIQDQREALEQCRSDRLLMVQLQQDLAAQRSLQHSKLTSNPKVTLVRSLSYARFGDMRKVWLEMEDFNQSKVYGLVYNDLAAGIVVASQKQPLALLNGDPKSSYAVFVGKNHAPGIVHGTNSDTLTVKYIPTWIPIAVGDEVYTSGMDNLFFRGLKVGKVLSKTLSQGYQSAVISPYYNADDPGYFHVIRAVR